MDNFCKWENFLGYFYKIFLWTLPSCNLLKSRVIQRFGVSYQDLFSSDDSNNYFKPKVWLFGIKPIDLTSL